MRRFILPLLLGAATIPMLAYNSYGIPENIQDGNIFHAFNWKFTDIVAELPRIAEAGFGAIQVSPVQGNAKTNAEWFYAYMPYDFAFTDAHCNGNGTRSQLKTLCEEADKYGIKIVVDVVANHVNKSKGNRNAWWNQEGRERNLGAINYNNRNSVTTHNLGEYYDVVSENPEVQQRAVDFLEDLKTLGVKGIRWDAAKHIGLPSEGCDFFKSVTAVDGLWHYGELLDNPGTNSDSQWKVAKEYADYVGVTDNLFCKSVLQSMRNGNIPVYATAHCESFNFSGHGISPDRVVYWGESHDTYANNGGDTKNASQDIIDRVYIFGACRAHETALYFSRPEKRAYADIKMGVKGSTHGLESAEIAAVNKFRNLMYGREEGIYTKPGSSGYLCVTRKDGGALILFPKKKEGDVEAVNVNSYMPTGKYKEVLTGNEFEVTPETIKGHVGAYGLAILQAISDTAVGEIEAEDSNAPVEYYSLQGIKVENLQPGEIYIKRQGGRATKIIN